MKTGVDNAPQEACRRLSVAEVECQEIIVFYTLSIDHLFGLAQAVCLRLYYSRHFGYGWTLLAVGNMRAARLICDLDLY